MSGIINLDLDTAMKVYQNRYAQEMSWTNFLYCMRRGLQRLQMSDEYNQEKQGLIDNREKNMVLLYREAQLVKLLQDETI